MPAVAEKPTPTEGPVPREIMSAVESKLIDVECWLATCRAAVQHAINESGGGSEVHPLYGVQAILKHLEDTVQTDVWDMMQGKRGRSANGGGGA